MCESLEEKLKNRGFKIDTELNNTCYLKLGKAEKRIEFPNYEKLTPIGYGGNAVVIKGVHKLTLRTDAIKIYVPKEKVDNVQELEKKFLYEVRKIAKLNDKRFVTIYDAYSLNSNIYILTMEMVKGKTLSEWINENHSKIECIAISIKILDAIKFYQEKGLMHGDIHSKNIIIDDNNEIHIIDFGTSIFDGEKYENQRESYFILDDVKKILKSEFNNDYFLFKKCSDINDEDVTNNNDIRLYDSYLVTLTLKSYVEYLDLIEQFDIENINKAEIADLLKKLSDGIYYNVNYIIDEVLKIGKKSVDKDYIINFLCEGWQEDIVPENNTESLYEGSNIFQNTLNAYFNLASSKLNDFNWDIYIDEFKNVFGAFNVDYNVFIDLIKKNECNIYEKFIKYADSKFSNHREKCDFEDGMRSLLYIALKKYYNNDMQLYYELRISMYKIRKKKFNA